ncbi:MAG: ABC transporter permease [Phycisphaerales bacterium]|nr:ABC transporter permease [Phycisphaerales bacterium]
MESVVSKLSTLRHLQHVVVYRAFAELRAEASRTYAGFLWWIIHPLLMFGVYYIAFNFIMANRTENFAIFLFTGIVLWQWFTVSVMRCAGSLIAARPLMQQVNLHKSVFPFSIILVNTVKFGITLVILFIVLLIAGYRPGLAWLALPILLFIQLLVIAAAGCFSAMISPFVPDFQHVLTTVLHLMFFISGIIYNLSMLPEHIRAVLAFNPMGILIEQTRNVLMSNQLPDWSMLTIPIAEAFIVLSISMALLHRYDKVYPKIG